MQIVVYRMMLALFIVLLASACGSMPSKRSAEGTVYEETLENGLKVVVKVDTRAPIVVSQIWYKVGGSYEPSGKTGISHVLEHMMFKGTGQLGPNEFSRVIAANGGRENAFTGRDYTAYFQRLEKSRLPISFKLEADRMQNLKFDLNEFKKEIEVVKEERRLRTDDRPESLAYEKFMATAYQAGNYRNPIIGWPEDLDSLRLEELRKWYMRFYAPNNATLVVAGDVETEFVFSLAKKHFGKIPRRDIGSAADVAEPPQREMRRIQVKAPVEVPYMLVGFHTPSINRGNPDDWKPYALEILAYILDGGKSARFETELVRKQRVASSVGVSYDPVSRLSSLFVINARPANGRRMDELENALLSVIERVKTDLISKKELDKVAAQIVASNVFERDSVFYQAMKLGELETVGLDWQLEEQMVDRLRAVTPQQVRAVAREFLIPTNMTISVLEPQRLDGQSG